MTDRTAVPERVSQRAKTARRGGGSGSQAVGDYVGQPAGEAAQAVRRAGLRPGLDRSFGCPAELVGLVVAQDPAAGSGLARNGMVTLYVAAPGGEPLDGDAEAPTAAGSASDDELLLAEPAGDSLSTPTVPVRARRRKRGRAQRLPAPVEPPPFVPDAAASLHALAQAAAQPLGEWPPELDAPAGALEDELAGELGEREFPHEDFVVHVEDVLAGRSGPGWRRAYPRRRVVRGLGDRGRVRGWLGEHRVLAGTVGAALALWMVVGAASVLDGRHARPAAAGVVAPSHALGARDRAPALKPPAAQRSNAPSTAAARSPRPYTVQHRASRAGPSRPVQHRAPRLVHPVAPAVRETVAPSPRQAPAPQPSAGVPPQASAPPAPAPEQSRGGLFSP